MGWLKGSPKDFKNISLLLVSAASNNAIKLFPRETQGEIYCAHFTTRRSLIFLPFQTCINSRMKQVGEEEKMKQELPSQTTHNKVIEKKALDYKKGLLQQSKDRKLRWPDKVNRDHQSKHSLFGRRSGRCNSRLFWLILRGHIYIQAQPKNKYIHYTKHATFLHSRCYGSTYLGCACQK